LQAFPFGPELVLFSSWDPASCSIYQRVIQTFLAGSIKTSLWVQLIVTLIFPSHLPQICPFSHPA